MMKKHLLLWHVGLGDAVMCHGLVRSLVERYGDLTLPVLPPYANSIRWMFCDDPRIEFIVLEGWNKIIDDLEIHRRHISNWIDTSNYYVTSIGFLNESDRLFDGSSDPIDVRFYKQANVPWEAKYTKVKFLKAPNQISVPDVPYAFIHEDPTRNLLIDHSLVSNSLLKVYATDYHVDNIFQYSDLLRNASEIHVIDSSFANIVEVWGIPCKKFLYDAKHIRFCQGWPAYRRDWIVCETYTSSNLWQSK